MKELYILSAGKASFGLFVFSQLELNILEKYDKY